MISHDRYLIMREFFRMKGERALEEQNLPEADYASGVVRGLDLAFEDGTARSILDRI